MPSKSRLSIRAVAMLRAKSAPSAITAVSTTLHRLLSTATTPSMPSVTLYQYAICPFCNKAKALLDYAGVPYKTVEVNPLTKAELKPWSGDYRKVPIAMIDEKQVNGSNDIVREVVRSPAVIASLENKWDGNMSMDYFLSSADSMRWQSFAEEELASLLYPNICRTLGDSYKAFGYVDGVSSFSSMQKMVIRTLGSVAMYLAASKIKSKRGINDEQAALDDVLKKWEIDGLGNDKKFCSGADIPSLGDVVVFGVLRSVEGLPAHDRAIMQRRDGPIPAWYSRMKQQLERP